MLTLKGNDQTLGPKRFDSEAGRDSAIKMDVSAVNYVLPCALRSGFSTPIPTKRKGIVYFEGVTVYTPQKRLLIKGMNLSNVRVMSQTSILSLSPVWTR